MKLTVQDVLQFASLKEAAVLTKRQGLQNEVSGVMIVEASDIENWAREGELLLSSFFALQDLSPIEVKTFFKKMHQLKLSGLIIKVDRLVEQIPDLILQACTQYAIPLIKIPKETKYEPILLEVMGTLMNNNVILLEKYYALQNQFTKMALTEPQLIDILFVLKELIQKPVSLKNTLKEQWISTDPIFDNAVIKDTVPLNKKKYMNYDYIKRHVSYKHIEDQQFLTQLVVHIPNLEFNSFELIIHEMNSPVPHEDYMAIENTVSFLQMELLKQYAVSQNNLNYKNNIIYDLLNNRMENKEEIKEKIRSLQLTESPSYRVIICKYSNLISTQKQLSKPANTFAAFFSEEIKRKWQNCVYLIRDNKVVFIVDTKDENDNQIKEKLKQVSSLIKSNLGLNKLKLAISFSSVDDLFHLSDLYKEANDTQKIIELFGETEAVYSYQDIGIYQLFSESTNIKQFIKYIPVPLLELEENHSDLIETLKVFLDTNQNYKTTAAILFVHPKTVRYRIDKIKKLTTINFSNAEQLLQLNIGLRILKLVSHQKTN